jgi:hypothetical protein
MAALDSGEQYTAHGVPPEDMERLVHRIRYQASRMGITINITTDKRNRTVTIKAR